MAASNTLTLSSATFAKLSPHPYLLANLQPSDASIPSARTNGRQPRQARPPYINTSSLSHAHGSAVVRTGDTTVICGVRAETLLTNQIPNYRVQTDNDLATANTNELRDYDLLVPNIELATGCAPNFLPGVPPSALAQTLSTRVYSLLHSSKLLDAADLRIAHQNLDLPPRLDDEERAGSQDSAQAEVKAYWVLYIDVLFISLDGNPFDAAWASIVAALRDTKLPKSYWDPDREMVLCERQASPLTIRGMPVATTAAVFTAKERQQQKRGSGQFWMLVDPDRLEESLCHESVTVVVDRSQGGETQILGLSKSGGTTVGPEVLRRITAIAEERWAEFRKALA